MKTNRLLSRLEQLETRRLMAATAGVVDDVLYIRGTAGKDAIVVALDQADDQMMLVKLNGKTKTFDVSEFLSIKIEALGGNDKIGISEKNGAIFLSTILDGGKGNDSIVGGSGNDVIIGGAGKDTLKGGGGDDQIVGGQGDDKLTGGEDNDVIDAGVGKDQIDGGAGNDDLDGGAGKDKIVTGAGEDAVAADKKGATEVKDRGDDDREYRTADFADLPTELQELHEEVIPGSEVYKVQLDGTTVTLLYHFGNDPQTYKTVLDTAGEEIELVSRELSLDELRDAARDAFDERHPNLGITSVLSKSQGVFEIRYRDESGAMQTYTTNQLIWGLDDAAEDANNNGYFDKAETREGFDFSDFIENQNHEGDENNEGPEGEDHGQNQGDGDQQHQPDGQGQHEGDGQPYDQGGEGGQNHPPGGDGGQNNDSDDGQGEPNVGAGRTTDRDERATVFSDGKYGGIRRAIELW